MSFWKKKKYCEYCGSEKKSDGSCSNPKCIAYNEKTAEDSSTKSDSTTTKEE